MSRATYTKGGALLGLLLSAGLAGAEEPKGPPDPTRRPQVRTYSSVTVVSDPAQAPRLPSRVGSPAAEGRVAREVPPAVSERPQREDRVEAGRPQHESLRELRQEIRQDLRELRRDIREAERTTPGQRMNPSPGREIRPLPANAMGAAQRERAVEHEHAREHIRPAEHPTPKN